MKKLKKKTRWQLVKELDSIFSKYIRLKYANEKGMCQCYTCGNIDHYKNLQNWHFLSRSNYKYRRDEDNCRVQCYGCNIIKSGNYKIYTLKMVDEYTRERIEDRINDKSLCKISTPELEEKILIYKISVEALLKSIK